MYDVLTLAELRSEFEDNENEIISAQAEVDELTIIRGGILSEIHRRESNGDV